MGFTYQRFLQLIENSSERVYLTVANWHQDFWGQQEVQDILAGLAMKKYDVRIRTDNSKLLPDILKTKGVRIDDNYTQDNKAPVNIFDDGLVKLALDEDAGEVPWCMDLEHVKGFVREKLSLFDF